MFEFVIYRNITINRETYGESMFIERRKPIISKKYSDLKLSFSEKWSYNPSKPPSFKWQCVYMDLQKLFK